MLLTRQVICASRSLHAKKYAKLYVWIHDVSGMQAIRFGSWEWYNIDRYRYLVKSRHINSNTFLDIGSNIGFYSCNLSGYFSSVLAFEPNPIAFNILKANIMLAEKKSSTSHNCFNIALGSNVNPIQLELLSGDNSAVSSLNQSLSTSCFNSAYTVQVVNASNLIFDKMPDINAVSAIKIDVEGFEINVLNGLSKYFESVDNLPLLTIEMLNIADNPQIVNLLVGYGYNYFYSYKRNRLTEFFGLRPFMFRLSPEQLSVGLFQLVYCSSYPLSFE